MDAQRRRFFQAISHIVAGQEDRDSLVPYLQEPGRGHRKFGVRKQHYEVFRRALIATLQRCAAPPTASSTTASP
jgi:hemoglobin-like flavoprotein